ncbi:MAG: DUF4258 domain-containing protein [Gammaproteobacteria bacterium]|nr:DUF4258 domain-containing protein [Gammaproteobacteria bacterium]
MSKCPEGAEPSFSTITRHAERRMRQRGLRDADVKLVKECGTVAPYGRVVLLDRDADREIREYKRRIQTLERLRGCVVVTDGTTVITCYRPVGKARRRTLRRKRTRDQWKRRPAKCRRDLSR